MSATKIIPRVAQYFGDPEAKPVIVAGFRPEQAVEDLHVTLDSGLGARAGWTRAAFDKHVSRSWLRKLVDLGYTDVRLALNGREADFSIKELLA